MSPSPVRAAWALIAFTSLLAFSAPALPAQNRQEIVPLGDPVYATLDDLYLEAGIARYSGARPFSAAELSRALARIPAGRLSRTGAAALERAEGRLRPTPQYAEGELFAFSGSLSAALEGYLHVPIDASGRGEAPYVWSYGYEDRMPLATVTAELFLSGLMWMGTSFDLKEEYRAIDDRMSPPGKEAGRAETNHWSIPAKLSDLDTFFPFRGAMAIGNDVVSMEFGRDYLDWGNGRTGNLIISDYTDYYDFLRFAVFAKAFKFSSMFSTFQPDTDEDQLFLGLTAHRLEFAPWDFLRISVTESLALGGDGLDPDFYYPDYVHDLNPVSIYHAWLSRSRANSMMAAEIDLAPIKFVNLYAQVGLDELQTPAESEAGVVDNSDALGYIAGIRSSLPLGEGRFRLDYEFVKTDPWLYNRSKPPYFRSQRRLWSFIDPALDEWVVKPTGYQAGPDALVHDAEIGYELPGSFKAAIGFGWTQKGEIDLTDSYPSPGDPTFDAQSPTGVAQETAELRLSGAWTPLPWLELSGGLRLIQQRNVGHIRGQSTQDIELALGLRSTLR